MATAYLSAAALKHNLKLIRQRLQPTTRLLAAVKADGYGHGAALIAQLLAQAGVDWFGVATAEEALTLREGGIGGHILIFSPVYEQLAALLQAGIRLTVADGESWRALRAAMPQGGRPRVHLKVDTGMGRLGLAPERALPLAIELAEAGVLEGVWTHFASADDPDDRFTRAQLARFRGFLAALERAGMRPLAHASNSAAIFSQPQAHLDLVRPGIALYGYPSSPHIAELAPTLQPVMRLTARVTFVKRVDAGTPISYGGLWRAPRPTTIATVRFGYADGYPRGLSGKAEVLIHGVKRPVVGRICMDQLMVDVGELPVKLGDEVTLFGPELSAELLAQALDTIAYELLTGVGNRVRRVLVD